MLRFFSKKNKIEATKREVYTQDYIDATPLAEYFHSQTGIIFEKQIEILRSKLTSFCKRREIASFANLLHDIKSDEELMQELVNYLTTNETFFYREFKQIAKLVELAKQQTSKVEILSAPSATGEEPYSIAIAMLEAGISNFSIVGIDINSDALHSARDALYSERNLRNLSTSIILKYFTKEQDRFRLKEVVKSHTTFKLSNLFDSSFENLGKFDFVFSRNMLIYFDKETKLKAKKILEGMRKDDSCDVFFGHADLF